jgi:putative transcriptional regulator
MPVSGQVGLVLPESDLDAVAAGVHRARAFLGFAGWGGGQLDGEVERDDWIVTDFRPDDAFTEDPDALWKRVLGRKGGAYALLATMPPDPSVN